MKLTMADVKITNIIQALIFPVLFIFPALTFELLERMLEKNSFYNRDFKFKTIKMKFY